MPSSYEASLQRLAALSPAPSAPNPTATVANKLAAVSPAARQGLAKVGQLSYDDPIWRTIVLASIAASAYHGVKRNHGDIGWGIGWGVCGALFPVITPAIAVAQGFGKPE